MFLLISVLGVSIAGQSFAQIVHPGQPPKPLPPPILGPPPQDDNATGFNAAACGGDDSTMIPYVAKTAEDYQNKLEGYSELAANANKVKIKKAARVKVVGANSVNIANTDSFVCVIANQINSIVRTGQNTAYDSQYRGLNVVANRILNISSVGGDANITGYNAIFTVSQIEGDLTIEAPHIARVLRVKGDVVVNRSTVGLIALVDGDIHIYNSHVQQISFTKGRICLHNGATVGKVRAVKSLPSRQCE